MNNSFATPIRNVFNDHRVGVFGIFIGDFDYEENPTEETHLHVGQGILRDGGWPEEIVLAICSHADYMHIPRDTPLRKAIYACDELVGFIGACVKVRPSKKLAGCQDLSTTWDALAAL